MLSYSQITGGIAAFAHVDDQSNRDYGSFIDGDPATYASSGSDPHTESESFGSGDTTTLDPTRVARLSLDLSARADFFLFPGPTTSVDSETGTSVDGNLGQWITIQILPNGDEHVGDPVKVSSSATGTAEPYTIESNNAIATHYEAKVDYGHGPQTLLADGIPTGSPSNDGLQENIEMNQRIRIHGHRPWY